MDWIYHCSRDGNWFNKNKTSKTIEPPKEYSKSSMKIGQEMHKASKSEVANGLIKFKEFR